MDQNTLMKTLLDMAEDISATREIVKRHDAENFPKIEKALETIDHASKRMESKQNQDMAYFHQEKEALIGRIKPLENDYEKRLKLSQDTKARLMDIMWRAIGYTLSILGSGLVAGLVLLKSHLL